MWGLRAAGAVAVLAEPRQEIARTLFDAETPLPVAAVIEQTGYQAEQFALIHPGGAVGERLNKKPLQL